MKFWYKTAYIVYYYKEYKQFLELHYVNNHKS
jgi:hypothetical protein